MYLGYENGKIKHYTEQPLDLTLYNIDKIEETQDEYILDGDEYVLNDEIYKAKKAQETQKELIEYNYEQKAKKAYGGILINETYLFETNETSQSMITASLIGLQNAPDETTLNWKMYANNQPIVVPLTKIQLAQLFAFALDMINKAFGVEGLRNNELATATVENLNDIAWVEEYKKATDLAFGEINNKIEVVLVQPPVEEPVEETTEHL